MRVFWENFIYSIRLPQKQAVFNLNRIGMDITVLYMFMLIGIMSMPGLLQQIQINSSAEVYVQPFFYVIFFFIFYYLILVVIIFVSLSFIAYIATWFATLLKRKLRFAIMWKISASATTIPLLLYTAISFFYPLSNYFLLLSIIYVAFIIIKIILIYPKRKQRA